MRIIFFLLTCIYVCNKHNMRWVLVNTKCIIIINESEITFFFLRLFVNFIIQSRYKSSRFLWVFILKYSFLFLLMLFWLIPLEGNNHIQYLHLWIPKDMQMLYLWNIETKIIKTNKIKCLWPKHNLLSV